MIPILIDLFCGAGGASMGYHNAGFDIVGVDINPQPHYPFKFIHADALEFDLSGYDAIHASPPCQNYCWSTSRHRAQGKIYPDLISATRDLLLSTGVPYVIENVPCAPLINPVYLEGDLFNLGVIRRRLFETNWYLPQPAYIPHKQPVMRQSKRDPRIFIKKSAYCSVAGNGADGWSCKISDWQKAMGIEWMNRTEIKQAIPPAYTEYIGKYLMDIFRR